MCLKGKQKSTFLFLILIAAFPKSALAYKIHLKIIDILSTQTYQTDQGKSFTIKSF